MVSARWLCGTLLITALGSSGTAHAERRSTIAAEDVDLEGEGEIGIMTVSTHGRDGAWSGLGELSYGISRRWDLAFAQGLTSHPVDGTLARGATSARLRFRPVERGDWPVDTRVEVTLAKAPTTCAVTAAPRVTLGRNLLWNGALRITASVGAEVATAVGDATRDCGHGHATATTTAATWAGAVRARVRPTLDVAVETVGEIANVTKDSRATHAWVGPAVSWAPRPRVWFTAGVLVDVDGDGQELLARGMLGVTL